PAFWAIIAPVVVEPVNEILAISRCSVRALPASWPYPVTTFTTPSGKPASDASSANRRIVREVYSLGLITTVLPAAKAGASLDVVSVSGEFQGVIAATTPSGSRCV